MSSPSPDRRRLAAVTRDAGTGPGRRIIDEYGAWELAGLLGTAPPAPDIAALSGLSLLLALPTQRETIAALLQLDGVAERILLWPPGAAPEYLASLAASPLVDAVLTQWPPGPAPRIAAPHGAVPQFSTEWILFTSGTTGRPKPVAHTFATLARHLCAAGPQPGAPVWGTFYDIRRYGGLQVLLRALIGGGSLVLSGKQEKMPDFLARAARAGVTHMLGTPSEWRRALIAGIPPDFRPAYVRLSGEVADQAILDRLKLAFPASRIVHAFATTEAGLGFEVDDGMAGFPADLRRGVGGLVQIRVHDGEVLIRSPLAALGIRNPDNHLDLITASDADAWVHTGDMVQLQNGRYVFAGRRDRVINVGGEKVHPEEVEAVLNAHPAVAMSLVLPRRSPVTGSVVAARIVCRPGAAAAPLAAELRRFCQEKLAAHKIPVSVEVVRTLDVTAGGKMSRIHA